MGGGQHRGHGPDNTSGRRGSGGSGRDGYSGSGGRSPRPAPYGQGYERDHRRQPPPPPPHWDHNDGGSIGSRDRGRGGGGGGDQRSWRYGEFGTDPLERAVSAAGGGNTTSCAAGVGGGYTNSRTGGGGGSSYSRYNGGNSTASGRGGGGPSSASAAGSGSGSGGFKASGRDAAGDRGGRNLPWQRGTTSTTGSTGTNKAKEPLPRSTTTGIKQIIGGGIARPPTPPRRTSSEPHPPPHPQQPPQQQPHTLSQQQHHQSPSHAASRQQHTQQHFFPSSSPTAGAGSPRHNNQGSFGGGGGGKGGRGGSDWSAKYRQSIENRSSRHHHASSSASGPAAAASSSPQAMAVAFGETLDRLKRFVKTGPDDTVAAAGDISHASPDRRNESEHGARVGSPSARPSSSKTSAPNTSLQATSRSPRAGTSSKALPKLKAGGALGRGKQPTRNEMLKLAQGSKSASTLSSSRPSMMGAAARSKSPPPSARLAMQARPAYSPTKGKSRLSSAVIDVPLSKSMMARSVSSGAAGGAHALPKKGRAQPTNTPIAPSHTARLQARRFGRAAAAMNRENKEKTAKDTMELCAVGRQQKTSKIVPSTHGVQWQQEKVHMEVPTSKRPSFKQKEAAASTSKLGAIKAKAQAHSTAKHIATNKRASVPTSPPKASASIREAQGSSRRREVEKSSGDKTDADVMDKPVPQMALPALQQDNEVVEVPPPPKQQHQEGAPSQPQKAPTADRRTSTHTAVPAPQMVLPVLQQNDEVVEAAPPPKQQQQQQRQEEAPPPHKAATANHRIHTVHGITLDLDALDTDDARILDLSNVVISHPNEYDVLFGRGGLIGDHPGNKRFRDLVQACREDYTNCAKAEKSAVSHKIVRAIRTANPPGRFLKKQVADGHWYDVGCNEAVKKCSQTLRDRKLSEVTSTVDAASDGEWQATCDFFDDVMSISSTEDNDGGCDTVVASSDTPQLNAETITVDRDQGKQSNDADAEIAGTEKESDDLNRSKTPSLCGSSPPLPAKEEEEQKLELENDRSQSDSIDGSVVSNLSDIYNPAVMLVDQGTQKDSGTKEDNAMSIDDEPTTIKVAVSKKQCSIAVSKKQSFKARDDDSIMFIGSSSSSSSLSSSSSSDSSIEIIENNENKSSSSDSSKTKDQKDSNENKSAVKEAKGVGADNDDYDSSDDERSMKMNFIRPSEVKASPPTDSDVPMSISVKSSGPQSSVEAIQDTPLTASDSKPAAEDTAAQVLAESEVAPSKGEDYSSGKDSTGNDDGEASGKKRPLDRSPSSVYEDGSRKKYRQLTSSGDKKEAREGEVALSAPRPLIQGRTSADLDIMEFVPHLNRTELDDATGKPVHYITVYDMRMGKWNAIVRVCHHCSSFAVGGQSDRKRLSFNCVSLDLLNFLSNVSTPRYLV